MSVLGNGILPWHVEVTVDPGQTAAVVSVVKGWQGACRAHAGLAGFPNSLTEALEAIPTVRSVVGEGPQSAVLIPLRTVRGLTRERCRMSATLGTGPVAEAIERSCAAHGIDLDTPRRIDGADSPIEFSIRDVEGASASVILYPISRRRYQAPSVANLDLPEHLVLNRCNGGLHALARRVFAAGGLVSFRPRAPGQHERIEDTLALLPSVSQLLLSSRHGMMKTVATGLGIPTPHGWPKREPTLQSPIFDQLHTRLRERMPRDAIVVLHRHATGDSLFRCGETRTCEVPARPGFGPESRAARLQGSLLGLSLLERQRRHTPSDDTRWAALCRSAVDLGFQGTNTRPWRYPTHDDAITALERSAAD